MKTMPPEIKFLIFHESESKKYYAIYYERREIGTLLIDDVPLYNNRLNFKKNAEFGVEKLSRIINAIFCRFGAIEFKIGSV